MNLSLDTIRTVGKKDIPKDTELQIQVGSLPGTAHVKIKLPGQKIFSDLGDLQIKDGILELPVMLVFFSYAREDAEIVTQIAEKLLQDGFLTWIDTNNLLPGDKWKSKIKEGIEKADYVIVFLSKASKNKIGYVQKEFKYVLNQEEYRPNNSRFIIPVLMDDIEPPREFREIQWLKLWEGDFYQKLVNALSQ